MIILKKKLITVLFIFIVILGILFLLKNRIYVNTVSKATGYVVIIIDDFGNYGDGTDEIINIGIPITVAIMPFLPYTERDANEAYSKGLEIIMHVPMEPNRGKAEWLGPKGITVNLADKEIQVILNEGLDQIKYSVGMNNHMGSKVTQDRRAIKAVLEVAKKRNLFFIDSKTTSKSIVSEVAKEIGVVCLERDVFLDNVKKKSHIEKQLLKLADTALERGYAIGIGHVGPEGGTVTAEAIKSLYPVLQKKGVHFVTISELSEIVKQSEHKTEAPKR